MSPRIRPINVLFYGHTGADNLEDEARLARVVADWSAVLGERAGEFALLVNDKEKARRAQPGLDLRLHAYNPLFAFNPRLWLWGADLLVLSGHLDARESLLPGSALLAYASLATTAKLLGLKVVVQSLRAEAQGGLAQELLRRVLENADLVVAEDPATLGAYRQSGVSRELFMVHDGGFPLAAPSERESVSWLRSVDLDPERGPILCLALGERFAASTRENPSGAEPDPTSDPRAHFVGELTAFLDGFGQSREAQFAFMALGTEDLALAGDVAAGLRYRHRARVFGPHDLTHHELSILLAHSRHLVTTKPGALPFALAQACAPLAIAEGPTLLGAMRDIGLGADALDYLTPPNRHPNTFMLGAWLTERAAVYEAETSARDAHMQALRAGRLRRRDETRERLASLF